MSVRLADLVEAARQTAERDRGLVPEAEARRRAEALAASGAATGRFRGALRGAGRGRPEGSAVAGKLAFIAEVKGASPLAGTLRDRLRPAELALAYAANGAAAVSVLTEERHFGGALRHLEEVSGAVELPTLRKDFIVEPYQIYQAAVAGAAAVLLIADVLEPGHLRELVEVAHGVGLDALVEFHHLRDLEAAVDAGSGLIGVNNRDLDSMEVDAEHAVGVAVELPAEVVRVGESGVSEPSQVEALRRAGYDAVLVGTALVRAGDPGRALRRLREAS